MQDRNDEVPWYVRQLFSYYFFIVFAVTRAILLSSASTPLSDSRLENSAAGKFLGSDKMKKERVQRKGPSTDRLMKQQQL